VVAGDTEASVTVAIGHKDLTAALTTAATAGLALPASRELASLFGELVRRGQGGRGCHTVFDALVARSGPRAG
jgi:3-hydroxyisobutyrate dehydrogenase-like beta-hydroxyacid dehydrogenase